MKRMVLIVAVLLVMGQTAPRISDQRVQLQAGGTLRDAVNDGSIAANTTRVGCLVIDDPTDIDTFLFFRAEAATTIKGIDCLAIGGTSVQATVKECDSDGASCVASEAAITCGTTNTTDSGGIDDASVDAGDWMRLDLGTVTGVVESLQLCVSLSY